MLSSSVANGSGVTSVWYRFASDDVPGESYTWSFTGANPYQAGGMLAYRGVDETTFEDGACNNQGYSASPTLCPFANDNSPDLYVGFFTPENTKLSLPSDLSGRVMTQYTYGINFGVAVGDKSLMSPGTTPADIGSMNSAGWATVAVALKAVDPASIPISTPTSAPTSTPTSAPTPSPALSAIGLVGVTSSSGANETVPTGVQNGDLLLAFYSYWSHASAWAPAGWTLLSSSTASGSGVETVWYRFASNDAPGASYRWAFSGATPYEAGGMLAYRGVDPATFQDGVCDNHGYSSSPTLCSFTNGNSPDLYVGFFAPENTALSLPADLNRKAMIQYVYGAYFGAAAGDKTLASPGTVPADVGGMSSGGWATVAVALRALNSQNLPSGTPIPTSSAGGTIPTPLPTVIATGAPTAILTAIPTVAPTAVPTVVPTVAPTPVPTVAPTPVPTVAPTAIPTLAPTSIPTLAPTSVPTLAPTPVPTVAPTAIPTLAPTPIPTLAPTADPTTIPTTAPTAVPTAVPTAQPAVSMLAPANNSVITGTTYITAQKNWSNVSWINFYVDGGWIASSPPWSITWDSTAVSDGPHTLSVVAYDPNKVNLGSAATNVTVSNHSSPTATPTALPAGAPTPSATPTPVTGELRPTNLIPNNTMPSTSDLATFHSGVGACGGLDDCSYMQNVDGQFTGTTTAIIEFEADKWCPNCTILNPLDGQTYSFRDLAKAIAVNETNWHQWRSANLTSPDPMTGLMTLTPSHGDLENVTTSQPDAGSWGMFQIAEGSGQGWPSSWPLSAKSTAFNADFKLAEQMGVEQGHLDYLSDPGRAQTAIANGYPPYSNYTDANGVLHPASTDVNVLRWGAVGNWYSGGWYDSGAIQYIQQVQQILHNQPWAQPGF